MQAFPSTGTDLLLSSDERQLLRELLDRERTSLPVEIHHTRTKQFRDHLRTRLAAVEAILARLQGPPDHEIT